jgi:Rrf2 family protein
MPVLSLSKKARYAFHGLAYIAAFSRGKPVPFDEILAYLRAYSQSLTLSPTYIAKIFQTVSRAGLAEAVPGPNGGYQLSREPGRIRLVDIIEILDGPMLSECCLMSVGGCPRQERCGVRSVIREAELAQYRIYERETLASLCKKVEFPDPRTVQELRRRDLSSTDR